MKLEATVLDIIFRQIEPELVWKELHGQRPPELRALFLQKAIAIPSGYSSDEWEGIYKLYNAQGDGKADVLSPFRLLSKYADELLMLRSIGPCFRTAKALEWREISLPLGQDLFTTAMLASLEQGMRKPHRFCWPPAIPTDDPRLRSAYAGAAENHMHLLAGASTFNITWTRLMNSPSSILLLDKKMPGDTYLQTNMTALRTEKRWSLKLRVMLAAVLRKELFCRIFLRNMEDSALFRLEPELSSLYRKLHPDVHLLRRIYGVPFAQPDGRKECLDYAFTANLFEEREESWRLLGGERFFLYCCLRRSFEGKFSLLEQWYFYLYLLLKLQFRGEYIQVNGRVGFHNFHEYDSRKYRLWYNHSASLHEDYRQAVYGNMQSASLSSLEARVSPGKPNESNRAYLREIDASIRFAQADTESERTSLALHRMSALKHSKAETVSPKLPYFFVEHFAKRNDDTLKSRLPQMRHASFRLELQKRAMRLADELANSPYLCSRIRGIDACSNELLCRPEVFAVAFRFLRSFPAEALQYRFYHSLTVPRLGLTFHVGEDFFDVADGLRAVDEALRFLPFRSGDRLGHAIVLGLDLKSHYGTKNRRPILTKQAILDNCVWLLMRSAELGIPRDEAFLQRVKNKAEELLTTLYRYPIFKAQPFSCTLDDYYHSMLLRGDDPALYAFGYFHEKKKTSIYDSYAKCRIKDMDLNSFRSQQTVTQLVFRYHYSLRVKRLGEQTESVQIDDAYIAYVSKLQAAMRKLVDERGIGIECNPSSNVLIGTFRDYRKHPLFLFNNRSLPLENVPVQMHVSVNSDDPGVFDTTIDFEYALIAATLRDIRDEQGNRQISDREIEDYISSLVRMGKEQIFPPIEYRLRLSDDQFQSHIFEPDF